MLYWYLEIADMVVLCLPQRGECEARKKDRNNVHDWELGK
jgi:hypothetical protein